MNKRRIFQEKYIQRKIKSKANNKNNIINKKEISKYKSKYGINKKEK